MIVDEFHHAAAASYRKLINYFQPEFLLGLTATPERTDGGDLLALCQQNLVYRCDLVEGVREGLLAPFHYFGVPDDVDYTNIPWRSTRFDEEALTTAVATQRRAENAWSSSEQEEASALLASASPSGTRTSWRAFFRDGAVRAVAVHSGPTSAPARRLARAAGGRRAGHRLRRGHVQRGRRPADARHGDDAAADRVEDSLAAAVRPRVAKGRRQGTAHGDRLHRQPPGVPAQAADAVRASSRRPGDLQSARALANGRRRSCRLAARSRTSWRLLRSSGPCCAAGRDRTMHSSGTTATSRRCTAFGPLRRRSTRTGTTRGRFAERAGSWIRFVGSMGDLDPTAAARAREARRLYRFARHDGNGEELQDARAPRDAERGRFPGSIGINDLADQVARLATRTTRAADGLGDGTRAIGRH